MSLIRKRRLTDQQSRRIQKQQKNKQAKNTQQLKNTELLEGLIVAHYGKQLEVQVLSEPLSPPSAPIIAKGEPEPFWQPVMLNDVWRCHTSTNLPMLVAGDRVRWHADCNTGMGFIEALHERTNVITRPDRYHKVKPVVSNVDLMLIVFAPSPVPSAQLIDRYLVMSEHAGVKAILVLNKNDMLSDDGSEIALLKRYETLGYDTLQTNMYDDLSELTEVLKDKSVVFLGQSGVGKSSLINTLKPDALQRTNIISENSELGQHTTTTTRLMPFMGQGALIDSPGVREYGLWHLTSEDIQAGFIEINALHGQCKFRDCHHINEPQCAVKAAVNSGSIHTERFENMLTLIEEVKTN